jgi:flagellar biosynthesis protein FliQ
VDPASLTQWLVDALHLVLVLAAPAVLACFAVGLGAGFFQSATQANDPSVGFVPKLFAVGAVVLASRELMGHELMRFSTQLLHHIATVAR